MVLFGFDFGLKKIGISIGNDITLCARPFNIIHFKTKKKRFEYLDKLIFEWKPSALVVGIPLISYSDQKIQMSYKHCIRFSNQLRERYKIKVHLVDESNSSIEAQEYLSNNDPDDAIAAMLILQRYFDSNSKYL